MATNLMKGCGIASIRRARPPPGRARPACRVRTPDAPQATLRPMRDLTYPTVIRTARVAFTVFGLEFQMSGTENVPRTGGAVLAMNHLSYLDFIFGGLAAQPSKRL